MLESFFYPAVIQQHVYIFLLYDDSLDGTIKTFVYTSLAEEWPMAVPESPPWCDEHELLSFSST